VLLIQLGIVVGLLLSFIMILIATHPRLGVASRFYRTMTVVPEPPGSFQTHCPGASELP
jgi:hypothetical protein